MNTASTLTRLAALCVALAGAPALAVDAAWSGFATLGYARSDSPYTYQRFINEDGTLRRDSLIAGQLDLNLAPQWSATVQAKLAPAEDSDTAWRAQAAWAFVGWRPNNDWLVRVGKLRLPLYLYSESLDVGVSNDMARLPHEVYSISPTNDFSGLFVTRNFTVGEREFSVDGYGGQADTTARFWTRDGLPPVVPAGPMLRDVRIKVAGLVLTARDSDLTWRLGLQATDTRLSNGQGFPVRYPRVDLGPGLGFWKVDDALPGPAMSRADRIRNVVLTGGAEWQIGQGWRVAGELVRTLQRDTELGSDSLAGYLAVFKRVGAFTPYVSVARQQSSAGVREWYERLTSSSLPAQIPGAGQINAAQRIAAESLYAFDQRSLALGTSYALSPTAKIKAEWMRTRVGAMSTHFDTPPGQPDLRNQRVDSVSVNVSVAF
jgi:hypothetical protein